jgi:hypothetical protein
MRAAYVCRTDSNISIASFKRSGRRGEFVLTVYHLIWDRLQKKTNAYKNDKDIADRGTEIASHKVLPLGNNVCRMDSIRFRICYPSHPSDPLACCNGWMILTRSPESGFVKPIASSCDQMEENEIAGHVIYHVWEKCTQDFSWKTYRKRT